MKSIAIFNNKGGVGKTTFICNLASYLALNCQKRVLLIDADPQCNASTYLFSQAQLEETYTSEDPKTIQKIIEPIASGDGYITPENIPISHSDGFGIDVIMGDTRLATAEDLLSKDWVDGYGGDTRGLKTTMFMADLIQKLSHYDYILFDVGPSLGAINRCVLLACDFFVMPMSSDIFCLKAIDNIASKLTEWRDKIGRGMQEYCRQQHNDFKVGGVSYEFRLKFLGYINQQYKGKTVDGKVTPVKAYERIIEQMPNCIYNNLAAFYPTAFDKKNLLIGEIPNFNSLVPLSQMANKPISKLQGEDGIVGNHFSKVDSYAAVLNNIGVKLLNNIQEYDHLATRTSE